MRRMLCLIMLMTSHAAFAQWLIVSAPKLIEAGKPFSVETTLNCPMGGEAPPPTICEYPLIRFETSDSLGTVPDGHFYIPFESPAPGSFVLRTAGIQSITARSLVDGQVYGGAEIFVPVKPVPLLDGWGAIGLVLAIALATCLTIRSSGRL